MGKNSLSFKLEKTRITSRLITFFAAEPKKKKKTLKIKDSLCSYEILPFFAEIWFVAIQIIPITNM